MSAAPGPPAWRVPLVDVAAQNAALAPELAEAFGAVRASGRFVLGPHVARLESRLALEIGARHAVGVSSGSDALMLALRALGVGPGDEVITTPLTFVATAGAIVRAGARPVFADVDARTLCLDPGAVAGAMGSRVRAILPVHLFGRPARVAELQEIARRADAVVVEDVAQALGAASGGAPVGSVGAASATSFFPTKPLGALGDGGMVFTSDECVADRCRRLRVHGARSRDVYEEVSGNHRLDEVQAAFLLAKVEHLAAWRDARARRAADYSARLAGVASLELPPDDGPDSCAWSSYVVRVGDGRRDRVAEQLRARGVEAVAYYREPLHRQAAFRGARLSPVPRAEAASRELLALPLYAELTPHAVDLVVESVREALTR